MEYQLCTALPACQAGVPKINAAGIVRAAVREHGRISYGEMDA